MRRRFEASRYAPEAVGALVLIAIAVLIGTFLEAGVVRRWLSPPATLKVILPAQGLFGLSAGAAVEILGTEAGRIKRIVIDPDQSFYAEAEINSDMRTFIRRDSQAFIRKQFGIAGAAYLEVTRGTGEPLDWKFAVLEARVDRAPTEDLGALIADLRERIVPIIDETGRAVTGLADLAAQLRSPEGPLNHMLTNLDTISTRIASGDGPVGRLLTDRQMAQDLQRAAASANEVVARVQSILGEIDQTTRNLTAVSRSVRDQSAAIPELVASVNATLASLRTASRDLSQATPALPGLLTQTQQTTLELERLLVQLRSLWLLGGNGSGSDEADPRLSPLEVRP